MRKLPTKEALLRWADDTAERLDWGPREALLLSKFAAYADAAMEAWAAIATLMRQSRSSERKVQYMLRDFEALGLIRQTGKLHRISGTTRDVPIYVFCGFLEEFEAESMGARRAPIEVDGCTDGGGMGAQGVRPHNEQIEQTPSDEGDARAQEREALFEKLEAAAPKASLGNTIRDQARSELFALLDAGQDGEAVVAAAASWAADKAAKRRDTGLQFWLRDRKFRAWLPDAQDMRTEAKVLAANAAPSLPRDLAEAVYPKGLAKYMGGAVWIEAERLLVCRLEFQAGQVRAAARRELAALDVRVTSIKQRETEGVG